MTVAPLGRDGIAALKLLGPDDGVPPAVHSGRIHWVTAAAALLVTLISGPAMAERWRLEPSANLQLGYDDNPQFSALASEGSFVTSLNGSLKAARSNEMSHVGLMLGVASNVYSNATSLNNTGGYAGLDLGYRTDRQHLELGFQYLSQSTLYAQQPPSRLNQVNQRQETIAVGSGWGYLLNERTALDVTAKFQDVSFEDAPVVSGSDYRFGSVDLGVSHSLTERLAINASTGFDRYESQGITNNYNNLRFLIGASYQISEISDISAQVGGRSTSQTFEDDVSGGTQTERSFGPTFSVRYARRFEAGGGFTVDAYRDLAPTGYGEVVDTTGLSVDLKIRVRPQWKIGVAASAFRSRSPSGNAPRGDETALSIGPSLSYRIAESWGLSFGYLYRMQDFGAEDENAVSNAIYLNLSWAAPRDL